jgi:hypothetical protein
MAEIVRTSSQNLDPGYNVLVRFPGKASDKEAAAVLAAVASVCKTYSTTLRAGDKVEREALADGERIRVPVFVRRGEQSSRGYEIDFERAFRTFRDLELPTALSRLGEYAVRPGGGM